MRGVSSVSGDNAETIDRASGSLSDQLLQWRIADTTEIADGLVLRRSRSLDGDLYDNSETRSLSR